METVEASQEPSHILIVDDNGPNLLLAKKIVEKAGFQATTATDGASALQLVNETAFDLILLDIMMPGIDGFDVCQQIKESRNPSRNTPIIFLTAVTTPESIVKGLELGAVDYITKPIIAEVLKARVKTHLELSRQRKLLEQQVIVDELTGLLNRHGFIHDLKDRLNFHKRNNLSAALLFIDLDRFKNINDSLGHDAGDEVLQKVAGILKRTVRETDIVGRFGGDEFVIGLLDIKSPESAAKVSAKIISEISHPFVIHESEVFIGASIGITFFPNDAHLLGNLIKNGDNAMLQAKLAGKNCYAFYEKEMEVKAKRQLLLDSSLHHAVKNNEFVLLYQPQVESATGEIFGAEVLIRWQNPSEGLIPPGEFIPIAEKNGLIIPIGEFVLNEACRQTKRWHDLGLKKITISVNFSVKQFQQRNIVDIIKEAIESSGLDPQYLNVEITESLFMDNVQSTINKLQTLKDVRIGSSIDDFGTGYSSLSYLQRFPISHLKIDKAFVDTVVEDATIAKAIINLGKSLNLKVIAEGVETVEQNEALVEMGCQLAQGYLFGKPMSAEGFEEHLKQSVSKLQTA